MAEIQLQGERAKLQRVLRRWDLVLFSACAIIGLDTVALAASAGGEAIVWFVLSLLWFLIPYGFVTAELGTAFPAEGGIYTWASLAYGKLLGGITALLYYLTNPIWIGGSLTAVTIAAINAFYAPAHRPLGTAASIIVGLIFVWVSSLIAVVELKWGKWVGNIGTIIKIVTVLIFVGLVITYLAKNGMPAGGMRPRDLKPSISGFLAVVGVIVFLWVGFELQSSASEEMIDPKRDVTRSIFGSGVVSAVLYVAVIAGILLVLPTRQLSNVAGFTDAYAGVAKVLGSAGRGVGYVFAALIILTLVSSGSVWILGGSRVQAVAGLDGAAPRWFGRFSRQGTPAVMAIVSGLIGSFFVFEVFILANGSLGNFFAVMVGLVFSTATLCYAFSIPAVITLRKKYPDVPRPFKVPGGAVGLWVCVVLSELAIIVTGITVLWPGLIERLLGRSYDIKSPDNWGVSRVYFESVTLGTFVVIILIAVVFWLIGRWQTGREAGGTIEAPDAGVGVATDA